MMKFFSAICVIFVALAACGVRPNPAYCERDDQCDGRVCNLDTHRCEDALLPDASSRCTSNDMCPIGAPICREDQACHPCVFDDECPSTVCRPDGACELAENVLYVSPNGISAGTCDLSTPCALSFALEKVTPQRSTLRLSNGAYSIASDVVVHSPGTNVTIAGGPDAIIMRANNGPSIQSQSGATLTLRGFTAARGVACDNASLLVHRLRFDGATEARPWIYANNCTTTVSDAELRNSAAQGIHAPYGGTLTITNTRIDGSADDGISVGGGTCTVSNTTVAKGMQTGLDASNTELTVSRSMFFYNRQGGISGLNGRFDITNTFVFRNGDAASSEFGGVRISSTASGNRVLHNTIAYNDSNVSQNPPYAGGLYCTNGVAHNNLIYYNFAGNTTTTNAQYAGACDTAGSIIDDGSGPNLYFVRPAAEPFDFHLGNANSYAVGKGIVTSIGVDFDGQLRTNAPDVGADEFHP